MAKPLTLSRKVNNLLNLGWAAGKSFNSFKVELSRDPVLALYNPELEIELHTDANKDGSGGCIITETSRQTTESSKCEASYHSYKLETLAVGVRKFCNYLYGRKFTVVTDCNALRLTWTKRDLTPRIGRWWLELQDFDVVYRPGTRMRHVDALSRKGTADNTYKIIEDKVCKVINN